MKIGRAVGALALGLSAACATAPPRWVPAAGDYAPASNRYSIRFPRGWMRLANQDLVVASRDGILLQHISVRVLDTETPLGSSKKVLTRGMLPQEAAEVVRDAIASSPGMQGMTLLENVPAELGGQPGFKLLFAYKDGDGLKKKAIVYGALVGESLYEVRYSAPERHYFERDVTALEQVRASFKVGAPATARRPLPNPKADASPPQPPVAPRHPHVTEVNGDTLRDDYFWLRNKGTPEVEAYLRAEAAYAEAMMKPTEALQKSLYGEMLSRIQEDDSTPPVRIGSRWYYQRTEKGKQYPILCRKTAPGAPEQVILDVNALAAGKKFLGLGGWEVSDDGTRLAYTTDETGFRQYDLHVRDMRTGADGPEKIARVDSLAWTRDGRVLFYVIEDEQEKRPYQLWRHAVGSAGKDDLVYEEKDHSFSLEVDRSRSKDFIFVTSASHTTSEVRFFRADDAKAALALIQPREPGHEYYADARGGTLYIRTNSGGRNFRLVTAPVGAPGKANWKEVVAHRDDVMLQDVEVFRDFVALSEREGGLPQITFLDPSTGARRRVQFAEADYEVSPDKNPEYDQKELRVVYQSPVTPQSWIDVDAASFAQTVVKRQPVPNYDASRYQVERVWASAADGTRIPVAVLHKKDVARDGKSPLLLYGYGSYGVDIPDRFNSNLFSLADRGVTYAVAHIRGGGELGKKWHDQGRMMNKMNTFTDFIACAEHLVAQGYTSKDRFAITGGSAGGLLMGAVTNLRPDLFHSVVTYVPFVDVINTMLDESLPLTVGEFEEWGNPKKPDEYRYMKQYSPYDNVVAKAYPTMLVRSSYNDSQVMYWEPAKYVAKLRAVKTDSNPLLFNIKMDPAGHGGASGRYDRLKDVAYDYAFILRQLTPSP